MALIPTKGGTFGLRRHGADAALLCRKQGFPAPSNHRQARLDARNP